MISNEKWGKGQNGEREFHDQMGLLEGYLHYKETYRQYFDYLKVTGWPVKIIEVGPADYPALMYYPVDSDKYVIEPMPSEKLKLFCEIEGITLIESKAEDYSWKQVDEVWFLNILQHVQDPEKIINMAKAHSNVIRFFEPINTPIDSMHFHSFTMDYFKSFFGNVKHYPNNPNAVKFHQHECAYGVWTK